MKRHQQDDNRNHFQPTYKHANKERATQTETINHRDLRRSYSYISGLLRVGGCRRDNPVKSGTKQAEGP